MCVSLAYDYDKTISHDLFELLEKLQTSRLDDQRCVLPAYFTQVMNLVFNYLFSLEHRCPLGQCRATFALKRVSLRYVHSRKLLESLQTETNETGSRAKSFVAEVKSSADLLIEGSRGIEQHEFAVGKLDT